MPSWSDLAADKKRRQQKAIPQEWLITPPPETTLNVTGIPETCGLLTPRELAITDEDVNTLLKRLAGGEWSAVEVTIAFYKRAIVAQQLVNCLTEIFVERALARAAELDDALKKTGKVVGPLHGLPISLKDQLCIKGLETTIGYVSLIGEYAEKNAVLVDILEECGAVPFVRTNVPQTLMWGETLNNIFGRTTNPYNRSLTAGGSSGGESALVALKGSPIGVGSDIGGSVRVPSAFCGVYGLKPSYGRVPYSGALNSLEGQDSVLSVFGPITSSISGLKTFMEAVIKAKPWLRDPLAVRKKWDEAEYQLKDRDNGRKLCFAIMWDDGVCVPHLPITRALKRVQEVLTNAGHNVITWYPIEHRRLGSLTKEIWDAGSLEDFALATSASGEPLIATMVPAGNKVTAASFRARESGLTAYQLWQVQKERKDIRALYMEHWNNSVASTGTGRPVDAIICPASPYAAPPHGHSKFNHYSVVWNALDYTASIFPVTTVDPAIDVKQPCESFIDAFDREVYDMYEPEAFQDAPICLQLVGRTLEEEAVIAMTEIVDAALKARPQ
ncbi:general amidase [Boletus edulis BED1]|uniref:amidase n=1 Tax=Boletus edulis BED1 TaxID=1328754 RepID=A0AAD4BD22_BOLED|nr:general amidase [Boletus edulis BED1]